MKNQFVVRTLINKANAVLDKDGRLLADQLEAAYRTQRPTTVSFEGIDLVTSAFLTASWGRFLLHVATVAERQARIAAVTFVYLAPDAHRTAIVRQMLDRIERKALDAEYCRQYDEALAEAA